jgi:hypothetical protein
MSWAVFFRLITLVRAAMHQGFSEYYRERASVEYTSGSKFIAFVCTHRSQVRERERERLTA